MRDGSVGIAADEFVIHLAPKIAKWVFQTEEHGNRGGVMGTAVSLQDIIG